MEVIATSISLRRMIPMM